MTAEPTEPERPVFEEPPAPTNRRRLRASSAKWTVRFARSVMLLVLFLAIPLGVGMLFGGVRAGVGAALGAVMLLSSSMANGRRATRYAAPLMALALGLGALTSPRAAGGIDSPLGGWLWLIVVVGFAVASGLATQRSAGVAVATATLYAVIAPPVHNVQHLLIALAWVGLGSVYGWFLAGRLGAPTLSPAPPASARSARLIALFLGIAVGLSCLIVILTDVPHSTWIVTAVVVLGVPTPGFTEKAIVFRMIGQVAACVIVALVSGAIHLTDPSLHRALFIAATVLALLAYLMSLGEPLALQIAFFSSAVMMPVAAKDREGIGGIGGIVSDRLVDNILGLSILALALIAVRIWADERPSRPVT